MNMLSGVCENTFEMKRNSPMRSDTSRQAEVGLNFRGGMGIYHKTTHTIKNRSKVNLIIRYLIALQDI